MAIVREFKSGGATIRIDDSCVLKSDEDTKRILDECARVAYKWLFLQEMKRREQEGMKERGGDGRCLESECLQESASDFAPAQ